MMGCMAQSKKEELFKELPRLDLVVGTQKYHRVFEHVDGILRARQERRMDELQTAFSGTHVCDVAEEADSQNRIRDHLNPGARSTAYVSIMQGCEMKCAYCIVPYTRGAERSRPIRDVVDEVKMLADAGVKEVTLLGQIVNRYGRQMETADGKGGFSLRQLRVGSTLDDASVEVLAGLSGGETIALDPVRAGLVRRKP